MPRKQREIQHPVLLLQTLQERVLPDRTIARLELVVRAVALLIERVDPAWKASCQTECFALSEGQGGAFVESRAGEDACTS